MFRFNVNPDSEIPIYRQLVDQINAAIRSGAIPTGTQLPTVREMAERMHLSCGTVKRVYDRLQEMGDIEMTRRRGTFVKYVREDRDSRKMQAMAAIDRMIKQLTDLSFSPAEIEIFLNLKMREWGLKWSGIRISMVMDCPELSSRLERPLNQIGNVRVSICTPKQLREYPYSIDEQSDVILASPADAQRLGPILPDNRKLIRVAMALEPECAARLARLEGTVGVRGGEEFLALVKTCLPGDMHIVPSTGGEDFTIAAPGEEGAISFDYGIDAGSMLYLEERINRIRDERQLHPGALSF